MGDELGPEKHLNTQVVMCLIVNFANDPLL